MNAILSAAPSTESTHSLSLTHRSACRVAGTKPQADSQAHQRLTSSDRIAMHAIETRAATPDDADAVEDYHDRCFKNTYSSQLLAGAFNAPDREGTRQQFRDWFRPGSEFVTQVAVVDGTPIGHSHKAKR